MEVMNEINQKLDETERRAADVVRQLEQLDSLEQLLARAGHGLGDASAGITSLATAASTAVESLNETVGTFREAVETLRRSDPAAVREMLVRLEGELDRISTRLGAVDELAKELRETRTLVEEAVERLSGRSFMDWFLGR